MSLIVDRSFQRFSRVKRPSAGISLSTYFPRGTHYFYGYPAGENSGFLNHVPPITEELVAARAASCAGTDVTVISFAATTSPQVPEAVLEAFDIPRLDYQRSIVLPPVINLKLRGAERNQTIKDFLVNAGQPGSLVMAQPYAGDDIQRIYQIPAKLTCWLNDKSTMDQYIAAAVLPARLATYQNGAAFMADSHRLTLPYVAKATSSSAGDGVFICRVQADLDQAINNLRSLAGTIIVEQYIEPVKNYGIHFGIPYDKQQPIDVFGFNEQLTTAAGAFIGGIIQSVEFPSQLSALAAYLRDEVLPKIRAMGWYGLGCFDVLVDEQERFYFIDANFRMTGMSAYHCLLANGQLQAPLIGFSGEFTGSQAAFGQALLPHAGTHAPAKIMQIIALSRHGRDWNFNASLHFTDTADLRKKANKLLKNGIESSALRQIASGAGVGV
jgi:hypothetical protein